MKCALTGEQIKGTIDFHGHICQGVWIGIRAAELCLQRLGKHRDDDPIVAITETDMCAVDAIQFLVGCTFGKGNLIHRDYGKVAFSFYRRRDGQAFRAVLKAEAGGEEEEEAHELMRLIAEGKATDEQKKRCGELREKSLRLIREIDLGEMFEVAEVHNVPPRPPRILESLKCESCGEMTMESRTRRFGGKCFEAVEQKV